MISSGANHAGTTLQSATLSRPNDSRPARIIRHKSNDSLRLRTCDHTPLAVRTSAFNSSKKLGANHPMGPLELGDFIGLDICLAIMDVLYKETGDSKYRACPLIRKMVRGGNLGCKTGKGFYVYNADRTKTPVDQL